MYKIQKPYRTVDLFAGIGGIRIGFESAGCMNVFTSEWDTAAQKVYEANFNEKPFGDINDIPPNEIPDHDILLAGFPCQPFSIAGKKLGFEDHRGTLFFNIESILRAKRPYSFMLENVKSLKTHDSGRTFKIILETLENLGYTVYYKVLNSLNYGVPQKRERIYIVGFLEPIDFHFPHPLGYYQPLAEILEGDDTVAPNYYVSEILREKRNISVKGTPPNPSIWHENIGGNVSALPYSCALRAGGSYNYLLVNGKRRLTGREMLRLQGFPDDFKINVPYSQIRKLAGNSVTVPVIKLIADRLVRAIESKNIYVKEQQLSLFENV
ncbi:DNA cytosine methyltransferase [Ignavibacteriales bacterium]